MIYQLPSGKIVNISIESYLRMTDDDFKYMEERNMGSSCASHSLDIDDSELESLDIHEDVEIEIDVNSLDKDIFSIEDPSSEE